MCSREYEDMSVKVGDKVTIEIKKTESSGFAFVNGLKKA